MTLPCVTVHPAAETRSTPGTQQHWQFVQTAENHMFIFIAEVVRSSVTS